jgi:hypothetical protein
MSIPILLTLGRTSSVGITLHQVRSLAESLRLLLSLTKGQRSSSKSRLIKFFVLLQKLHGFSKLAAPNWIFKENDGGT